LQIIAGSGNPDRVDAIAAGAAGGSIEGIKINSALIDSLENGFTPSYELIAGDGQAGKTGGAGGSITTVIEKASTGTVKFQAGNGGKGNAGVGGAGGSVRGLEMQSDGTNYVVRAGDGGVGLGGGAGGSATNNSFANRSPSNSVIISADFDDDGLEDVLVVDSSTGAMVLSHNVNGSTFEKVVQYENEDLEEIITIGSLGTTPVDGYATDFDGDGDQDIIIAYKNSSNLGIFFNDGEGKFYKSEAGSWVVDGFTADLGVAPSLIAPGSFGSDSSSIVIISTEAGKSTAHYAVTSNDGEISLFGNGTPLKRLVTDVVTTSSTENSTHIFVGTLDGVLIELERLNDEDGPAFEAVDTTLRVSGGIANLDVSSNGERLLALSAGGKSMSLFDVGKGGALGTLEAPVFSPTGRAVMAHFVGSGNQNTADSIAVLSTLTAGSRFDVFAPAVPDQDPTTVDPAFTLSQTFAVQPSLKNFVVVEGAGQPGYAGVAGSLNQFYYSQSLSDLIEFSLPFEGKVVSITAGRGGDAFDLLKVVGKGGLGGSVSGLNVEANEIYVISGDGGNSFNGAAGSAGSVSNPALFTTASGASIAPALIADQVLQIAPGNGGTPTGPGSKLASGGNGGSLTGVKLQLATGEVQLSSGNGGNAKGGNAGNGGDMAGLAVTSLAGSLTLQTGTGGNAPTGKVKGGNGGSVKDLKFTLDLNAEAEKLENSYFVNVSTGTGGTAAEGTAGSGGSVINAALKLDGADVTYDDSTQTPPLVDAHRDSTVSISFSTGKGGDGAIGGHGGSLSGLSSLSVFDQSTDTEVIPNYFVMDVAAGAGGAGSAGIGGNGGSVGFAPAGLSGLTFFDADAVTPADNPDRIPLRIAAGAGGQGSTKGGAGGGISNLLVKNSPFGEGGAIAATQLSGAMLQSGAGGAGLTLDGGKGGDISGLTLGVEYGAHILTGDGGNGGASGKGGNGGSVAKADLGAIRAGFVSDVGIALIGGNGGSGGKGGGVGGGFNTIELAAPQLDAGYAAVLVAGDGGAATGAGATGGAGGAISKISQSKDVNSAINVMEAGNGGASLLGKGGAGGAISAIKTVGFIGRPTFSHSIFDQGHLGVFDENGLPQGLFAGRGGDGMTDGLAGSVTGVTARQIAAIAAAYDPVTQTFGIASKVAQVNASLIGYEVVRDNVFEDDNGGTASPFSTCPLDGFILAAAIASVNATRTGFIFTA
jgi:hypothetical protein